MLNRVELIGNLGRDPEIRRTQEGRKIANLRIATKEMWKDRQTGERRERTEWHSVVVFSDGLSGVCERYMSKGQLVYVCGQLQTRKWQDQSGQDRYTTEVVVKNYGHTIMMLERKSSSRDDEARGDDAHGYAHEYGEEQNFGQKRTFEDEIPF